MPIERAQINRIRGATSRAAYPEEPIPARDGGPIVGENSIGMPGARSNAQLAAPHRQ
jgi:hypothetical protein